MSMKLITIEVESAKEIILTLKDSITMNDHISNGEEDPLQEVIDFLQDKIDSLEDVHEPIN